MSKKKMKNTSENIHKGPEYYMMLIGKWYCRHCGRALYSFEDKCLWCNKKQPIPPLPPRHQYRGDIAEGTDGKRRYYEGDIVL